MENDLSAFKVICDQTEVERVTSAMSDALSAFVGRPEEDSIVTRQQVVNACASYLESLKDQKTIIHSHGGAYEIIGWTMDKRGHVSKKRQLVWHDHKVIENGPITFEFITDDRKLGPHRPRRKLRRYLNRLIGNQDWDLWVQPIPAIEYITLTCLVTKEGVSFAEASDEQTKTIV